MVIPITLMSSIFVGLAIKFIVGQFTVEYSGFSEESTESDTREGAAWIHNQYNHWATFKRDVSTGHVMVFSVIVATLSALFSSSHLVFFGICILGWALLLISIIDIKFMIIPDLLCLILCSSGLLFSYFVKDQLLAAIIGAVVGYGALRAFSSLYSRMRGHPGIGHGDAKLLGAGAAWTGWIELSDIVLVASITGIICFFVLTKTKAFPTGSAIPFGPALALGIWTVRLLQP